MLAIFIIGVIDIKMIAIIPIIPPVFPISFVAPTTLSKLSENSLPTTGIKFETAAWVVFTAIESTDELIVPSNDSTPKNRVNSIPVHQIAAPENNFETLSILKFSDTLNIILKATDIYKAWYK